jgi:hypothetical protein
VIPSFLDTWELRYVVKRLPTRFNAAELSRRFESLRSTIDERDVYLLTGSPDINLKLRSRENTLKMKVLHERAGDRLERWRTEMDLPLPAGAEALLVVLRLLGAKGDAARLGAAATAAEIVDLLSRVVHPERLLTLSKTRSLFRHRNTRIDLARFQVDPDSYARQWDSLGIESSQLADVRAEQATLRLRDLGVPRNYMEFLYGRLNE